MDFYVILLTGSISFVCTVIFKLIMNKMIRNTDVSEKTVAAFAYIMVFIFCIIVYSVILRYIAHNHVVDKLHFKLCYAIKSWTVAIALNSLFEHLLLDQTPRTGASEQDN